MCNWPSSVSLNGEEDERTNYYSTLSNTVPAFEEYMKGRLTDGDERHPQKEDVFADNLDVCPQIWALLVWAQRCNHIRRRNIHLLPFQNKFHMVLQQKDSIKHVDQTLFQQKVLTQDRVEIRGQRQNYESGVDQSNRSRQE